MEVTPPTIKVNWLKINGIRVPAEGYEGIVPTAIPLDIELGYECAEPHGFWNFQVADPVGEGGQRTTWYSVGLAVPVEKEGVAHLIFTPSGKGRVSFLFRHGEAPVYIQTFPVKETVHPQ